jgi:hypothetical protein
MKYCLVSGTKKIIHTRTHKLNNMYKFGIMAAFKYYTEITFALKKSREEEKTTT